MPGRSSTSSGSTRYISFSGIESALSSLKNFQSCISSGMDTVSSVALDLVETQTEVSSEYSMDKAMVEFAKMDRELSHYVKAVQSTINHVKEERPEKVPDLKLLVEKKFLALQDKNSDADFKENEKFVQFKQQLRELKKQLVKPKEDGRHSEFDPNKDSSRAGNKRDGIHADRENDLTEGVDEDMIVTQSQTNFICPITQLEMKKPVKNKMCGHTYEEEAIVRMIESKHKRKKKACCPKIGCSHTDMRMSDLIPDEALRRAIESHNKKKKRHSE
ncbi:E3 SUMO-protein ligase NSE2 isoform 3 [Mus musculus]|uniref:E3 SUMO-protein ligase NSE2 n=1 Tax=Mus musculus TaxID=10090 RepID=A0A2I3BS18_MOUSE|nr:E3 SUMO-protein ligase NSE2 isoform 3 [Mus musculus]EDL29328.1 non-SMC element 2 homolog (MMS21, S. cerevisiae), isoform CRA_a [Mus musculus]|eukprot:XP_006521379.1 PREDICTED: E3 SUMO-protein ligase NSE2 isoform X1 [Mus musculus]